MSQGTTARPPSTLYVVDVYPYGGAHSGIEPATVTPSLETALYVLADEIDAYADQLHETDLEEEDREELERALTWLDAAHGSASAWARYAGGTYAPAGAREFLSYGLQGPQGAPILAHDISVDVDEPGSFARGMTFTLRSTTAAELELTEEELEEILEEGEREQSPAPSVATHETRDERGRAWTVVSLRGEELCRTTREDVAARLVEELRAPVEVSA